MRAFGLSVYYMEEALWALNNEEFDIIQIPYNLLQREAEQTLFNHPHIDKIGVISRVPLAQGQLTDANSLNHAEIYAQAKKLGLSIPEYAMQFVSSNQHVDNVLFGTTQKKHLLDNLSVFK